MINSILILFNTSQPLPDINEYKKNFFLNYENNLYLNDFESTATKHNQHTITVEPPLNNFSNLKIAIFDIENINSGFEVEY